MNKKQLGDFFDHQYKILCLISMLKEKFSHLPNVWIYLSKHWRLSRKIFSQLFREATAGW